MRIQLRLMEFINYEILLINNVYMPHMPQFRSGKNETAFENIHLTLQK